MNIGYWLQESDEEDEQQLWIEAYACGLSNVWPRPPWAGDGSRKEGSGCPRSPG